MINFKSRNKGMVAVLTGLFVLAGTLAPLIDTANAAAVFNGGNEPFDLFMIANATQNPNCGGCWTTSTVNVKVGETIAMRVFYHNTSGETASNTKIRITADITNGGSEINTSGSLWASNAGTQSDSTSFNVTDGDAVSLKFLSAKLLDRHGNEVGSVGSSVLGSNGYNIGNVVPDGAGRIILNLLVEGENGDDDDDNDSDDLSATTKSANDIDEDSARLRCEVDTGDADADVWFEWGEDSGLDEETNSVSVNDNESNEIVTKTISGLDSDTKYFFRCRAEDDDGETDTGDKLTFRTDDNGDGDDNGNEPDVVTTAATGVDSVSATINGEVDPNDESTDAWFEWGTSSSNLNRRTSIQDVGSGDNDVRFSARLTGLTANTTYYYRAFAENNEGDDRGSVRSFRTTSPVVNVVTRFIDVFREVPVVEEPEQEVLIVTLEANAVDVDRQMIDYTVSYENRTRLTLTNAVLTVDIPNELVFERSNPRADDENRGELTFDIGRIAPGARDSFDIETTLDRDVDQNDTIRLVADVAYNDDGSARKVVEVVNESTFGEIVSGGGAFTATVLNALRDFFTNPLLWILIFIALIVFAVRYLVAARDRRSATLV